MSPKLIAKQHEGDMKIFVRKLNDGEHFCCSIKAAKEIFKDTDIKLNFGSFFRHYKPYSNEPGFSYYKKNITGTVILDFFMEYGDKNPRISFYVLRENAILRILQEKVEKNILQQILEYYNLMSQSKKRYIFFLVELRNKELVIHKYSIS